MKISKSIYNKLKIDEAKLTQLEINGVDNWAFYGCMCDKDNGQECIFCAEDPIKYLNLKEEGK
jgi:hypothetical protein